MSAIANRYDFVYLFDVTNGNPNGDPDAGNLPRLDPETNQGLVSDVCLKRKIRNFVAMAKGEEPGYEIYMAERAILNNQHKRAWQAAGHDTSKKDALRKLPKEEAKARELTAWMCANFFDIRAFGAVMTTGVNCGQVRGPVQFSFARSIEPVLPLEISITRMAATTEEDAEAKGDIRPWAASTSCPTGSIGRTATSRRIWPTMGRKEPASRTPTCNCSGMRCLTCSTTTVRPPAVKCQRAS